ncbi:capsule assembly Wzi family protein [Ferrimonas sediminicola]|uniref:Capsule assembly Wzi family protein n=1 Tax=Ferrimonas sediminicola TaxID=2569538 RepID=A0A4U1B793_9GAMM|nr:capsule assembly Wzi family protein [Ferrimonas sediminicola]TKB46456.1 capsule assembly Wzi family protein [Ferrimonas sediminicola]
MKQLLAVALAIGATGSFSVLAATPFISLQDDYLNQRIEQLVVMADMPVAKKPYNVKQVRNYVESIKLKAPGLYFEIDRGLKKYERQSWTINRAEVSVAAASEPDRTQIMPNARGESVGSSYRVSGSASYQPMEYAVFSVGGLAYDGDSDDLLPIDSYMALGWDSFQVDIGFREQWLSPFSDSAMMLSTNARPSFRVGISNPIAFEGLWNLHYEVAFTRLEEYKNIAYGEDIESGRPAILTTHLSVEPVKGWTISANRVMQFGGGSREVSFGSIWDAFWDPVSNDNTGSDGFDDCQSDDLTLCEFGNQLASVTSRINFEGDTPFSIYGEYAGEDTASHSNFRLGNLAVSGGIFVPFLPDYLLGRDWSFTYEFTQWQDAWYVHHIYQDGLTNDGVGMGHWLANDREPQNGVPGTAHTVKLGWQRGAGERYDLIFRQIQNDSNRSGSDYTTGRELDLRYYGSWRGQQWGYRLYGGQTVFDDSFARVEVNFKW